jgi:hypothetical protein
VKNEMGFFLFNQIYIAQNILFMTNLQEVKIFTLLSISQSFDKIGFSIKNTNNNKAVLKNGFIVVGILEMTISLQCYYFTNTKINSPRSQHLQCQNKQLNYKCHLKRNYRICQ